MHTLSLEIQFVTFRTHLMYRMKHVVRIRTSVISAGRPLLSERGYHLLRRKSSGYFAEALFHFSKYNMLSLKTVRFPGR